MAPISRSFGTLYIDGRPAEPGVQLPQSAENPKIEIGNSDGRFIHWVVVGGLLVSREDGTIFSGLVAEASQYDVILEAPNILGNVFCQPPRQGYYKAQDESLILDRESILEILPCAGVSVPF